VVPPTDVFDNSNVEVTVRQLDGTATTLSLQPSSKVEDIKDALQQEWGHLAVYLDLVHRDAANPLRNESLIKELPTGAELLCLMHVVGT
jgi:hypothetical protein